MFTQFHILYRAEFSPQNLGHQMRGMGRWASKALFTQGTLYPRASFPPRSKVLPNHLAYNNFSSHYRINYVGVHPLLQQIKCQKLPSHAVVQRQFSNFRSFENTFNIYLSAENPLWQGFQPHFAVGYTSSSRHFVAVMLYPFLPPSVLPSSIHPSILPWHIRQNIDMM